jgi:predicted nuclease with TOPRIM domain
MSTNNSKQSLIAIAAVVIVALLGVNAFLLIKNMNKNKQLEAQGIQLDETTRLKDSLETAYNQAVIELDQMKGTNAELNSVIDQQKAELAASKDRIAGLITNKKDLSRAREEIKNLKGQLEQYVAEINNLKSQNQELTSANQGLTQELTTQKSVNQDLETAKAALVSEKSQLETERTALSEKVNFASVVKVSEISAQGFSVKDSGKLSKKSYAKNVEQLKLCFKAAANKVAASGNEKFYVRIINPIGETVAIDDQGSGVMKSKETGDEIRYTQVLNEDYDNEEKSICMNWSSPTAFQKGNYEVEIYNKGFLAGKGTFRLK